ncbi:hypothetical protein AB0C50_07820 [Micromonospora taraxaci]|uniref:hypothetical protein n=1 Tax=Micromonospora taraxaci TaxID=1316803 RepID=UPI0033C6B174
MLPEAVGDARPSDHRHVGAERGDQVDVTLRRVGQHPVTGGLGELNRIAADGTGRPGHREGAAGLQSQLIQGVQGGQSVQRQSGRLGG